MPPVSGRRVVDFGIGLGRRTVFLYNLPEVASGNQYLKVGRCFLCPIMPVEGCPSNRAPLSDTTCYTHATERWRDMCSKW